MCFTVNPQRRKTERSFSYDMKIGIFGGTFSPPHIGHIRAAEAFICEIELDNLIIIPTFVPHNKDVSGVASPEARLHMCRLAFDSEKCNISDIEIKKRRKIYTADTLEELKSIYPDDEFFMLFGTDMFLILEKWFRVRDIFKMCTVVCICRENDVESKRKIIGKSDEYRERFGARVRLISLEPTEISSSLIRQRIKLGDDFSGLVTPSVRDYIYAEGLYK